MSSNAVCLPMSSGSVGVGGNNSTGRNTELFACNMTIRWLRASFPLCSQTPALVHSQETYTVNRFFCREVNTYNSNAGFNNKANNKNETMWNKKKYQNVVNKIPTYKTTNIYKEKNVRKLAVLLLSLGNYDINVGRDQLAPPIGSAS